ncbi:DUF202 domain-containing protein [Micrococcales bacterium 31B]|nr:DUF202 domain-containing protein [Micrococcales bacterium 31B]
MTSLPELRDPGLQPERTALSWRRTFMALLVNDFLIARSWMHAVHTSDSTEHVWQLGLATFAALIATGMWAGCVVVRTRQLRFSTDAPSARLLRVATSALMLLAGAILAALVL